MHQSLEMLNTVNATTNISKCVEELRDVVMPLSHRHHLRQDAVTTLQVYTAPRKAQAPVVRSFVIKASTLKNVHTITIAR